MSDDLYKELVFRFIDRMGDHCEVDPADKILGEFVAAFEKVWRDDPTNVFTERGQMKKDHPDFVTLKNDDVGVEGLSEGLDIGDGCPECGQLWSGTL